MFGISKPVIHTALIALGAFVIAALIQRKVISVPLIGDYLPK